MCLDEEDLATALKENEGQQTAHATIPILTLLDSSALSYHVADATLPAILATLRRPQQRRGKAKHHCVLGLPIRAPLLSAASLPHTFQTAPLVY